MPFKKTLQAKHFLSMISFDSLADHTGVLASFRRLAA